MHIPIVDYVSFTIPVPQLLDQWETMDRLDMGNLFDDRTTDFVEFLAKQENWRYFKNKGRFNQGVRFDDAGLSLLWGDKPDVTLAQFSGQGCKFLRDNDLIEGVLNAWLDKITRIDLAIDFESDADPEDVARQLSNKRFKTDAHEKSNTGVTWYVGSYKSDRFARVYRYSDKLKRGNTIRIEYQFSDGAARHASANILDKGIIMVMEELHNLYGWRHSDVVFDREHAKYQSPPRPKTRAGKEYWLREQVLPSLEKEGLAGNIEILVWLRDQLNGIIGECSPIQRS